jgi:hypothetical protein
MSMSEGEWLELLAMKRTSPFRQRRFERASRFWHRSCALLPWFPLYTFL